MQFKLTEEKTLVIGIYVLLCAGISFTEEIKVKMLTVQNTKSCSQLTFKADVLISLFVDFSFHLRDPVKILIELFDAPDH